MESLIIMSYTAPIGEKLVFFMNVEKHYKELMNRIRE